MAPGSSKVREERLLQAFGSSAVKTVALAPAWPEGVSVRVAVTITVSRIGATFSSIRSASAAHGSVEVWNPLRAASTRHGKPGVGA